MSALSLLPIAVRAASGTSLSTSQYFGMALIGADIIGNRLFKVATLIEKLASRSDEDAAQEMVDRMRADVPHDTGDLYNGISYFQQDGVWTVQASGVHPDKPGADYAGFVERGTRAGERGRKVSYVADSDYHDLSVDIGDGSRRPGRTYSRSRLQQRGHPGTPAQPFFYANAIDVLRERRADLGQVLGIEAAAAGDFN